MALDYQQVREQIIKIGEEAPTQVKQYLKLRDLAFNLLERYSTDVEYLRNIVKEISETTDPSIRCGVPVEEALNIGAPLPPHLNHATIIAADGSQIIPDRHAQIEFGLINVGAIQIKYGFPDAPKTTVYSSLIHGEHLYNLSDAAVALRRDLEERSCLLELAREAVVSPVISFTDGQMELWGGHGTNIDLVSNFQQSLETYKQVLFQLYKNDVITAGYVDKPASRLVIRLLELAAIPKEDQKDIKKIHPYMGIRDIDIYSLLLRSGERSAVFSIKSKFSSSYQDKLALHFFYLNVGLPNHPWLVRVEVPSWVVENKEKLDNLHAILVHQCRTMGMRPYPYLLHRAHEVAVVSLREKEQVSEMIAAELRKRGVKLEGISYKQSIKNLAGRTRYARR